jgi:ABC-type Fe3+ transport system substrate-binding protein
MRYLPLILFAIVLFGPVVLWRGLTARMHGSAVDASAERLVVVTPHPDDIRREFARVFNQWHVQRYGSAVAIDWRVPGGSTDMRRLIGALYQPYRDARTGALPSATPIGLDVVFGGGDYFFDVELKPLGVLQPMHLDPKLIADAFPQPTLAGVKLLDATRAADGTPTPLWVGTCLSSFGIVYNPDVYRAMGLPMPSPDHGWRDLTDPRLAGLVALADPAHSGSAAVAYQMVIQRNMADVEAQVFARRPALRNVPRAALARDADYRRAIAGGWKAGMVELLKIAANARYFTDSSPMVANDVSRGEAAAGVSIDYYARVTEGIVGSDRARYFAPTAATATTPDPVAILHGVRGRRLELATHFVEFLLSRQGQRLWELKPGAPGGPLERSLRRPPVRPDVYADRSDWADADLDPFTAAGGFNQRGEWMALFPDGRPIWVAAWIDARDALRDAYRAILRVADPTRRAALIEELADLPVEMSDIESLRNQRLELQRTQGDLDRWRAEQQIRWAARFRKHYASVRLRAAALR